MDKLFSLLRHRKAPLALLGLLPSILAASPMAMTPKEITNWIILALVGLLCLLIVVIAANH